MITLETTAAPRRLDIVCTGDPVRLDRLTGSCRVLAERGTLTAQTRILVDARPLNTLPPPDDLWVDLASLWNAPTLPAAVALLVGNGAQYSVAREAQAAIPSRITLAIFVDEREARRWVDGDAGANAPIPVPNRTGAA